MDIPNIAYQIYSGILPPANLREKHKEIYEVIRVSNGIALFIDDHLLRLNMSFKRLNSPLSINNLLINEIKKTIKFKKITNSNIKISCLLTKSNYYQIYIYAIPSSYPNVNMYKYGVQTSLFEGERINPNIKVAHTKVREAANMQVQEDHVFEVLLVNHNGYITEGSRSNLFFIIDNVIYTAPSELVLEGIIRKKVLDIIKDDKYSLEMKCIYFSDLQNVDAAFLTGTSSRILPINKIDDWHLNVNHHILRNLMESLNKRIEAYAIGR